jgi:hypothetical protein
MADGKRKSIDGADYLLRMDPAIFRGGPTGYRRSEVKMQNRATAMRKVNICKIKFHDQIDHRGTKLGNSFSHLRFG